MNYKISIIVPIYNVEQYLKQCLESIDMFDRIDIEIILVNDGSTDESLKVCNEFKERHNNVIVIDKQNGGLSDARNAGTNIARGDYLYYLDSDDWIAPHAIDKLYTFAIDNNCDIVQGGFFYAYNDRLLYDNRWFDENSNPFIIDRDIAMRELINSTYIQNFAWGKLYKANIAKQYKFPIGKFFEDNYWQHFIIHSSNIYGVIPEPLYYYRQRSDSISGSISPRALDLLKGREYRIPFLLDNYPALVCDLVDQLWESSFSMRNINNDFNHFFNHINNNYSSLLSKKFKKSLFYKLARNDSSFLSLFLFIQRIKNHFIKQKLKCIKLI